MTLKTEALESMNRKLQREKQYLKEKSQELEIWTKETLKEEQDISALRL